ncbi:MAG: GNAT family N-acetyltransferase [Halolamina sp.]
MDLREATSEDVDGIRTVAAASLSASYADVFDETERAAALESWYDRGELAEKLTDERSRFVVAVDDGEVVGFAETYRDEADEPVGRIDWLHVHPDHRGRGVGEQLLGRAESELAEAGAVRLEGRVLAPHEAGAEFYADHGYEPAGERTVDLNGRTLSERTFVRSASDATDDPKLVDTVDHDGETLYVAYDESSRGSEAPFFVVYEDDGRRDRYSWLCGGCETAVTAMDAMGRLTCDCGNARKPTRWDASYL